MEVIEPSARQGIDRIALAIRRGDQFFSGGACRNPIVQQRVNDELVVTVLVSLDGGHQCSRGSDPQFHRGPIDPWLVGIENTVRVGIVEHDARQNHIVGLVAKIDVVYLPVLGDDDAVVGASIGDVDLRSASSVLITQERDTSAIGDRRCRCEESRGSENFASIEN